MGSRRVRKKDSSTNLVPPVGRRRHTGHVVTGPYWCDAEIPNLFDIAVLKPASLPKSQRFETSADAKERSRVVERMLRRASESCSLALADDLAACRRGRHLCGNPVCPLCARKYRRWFAAELLQAEGVMDRGLAKVVTVYLAEVEVGHLHEADLIKLHANLRIRLRRSGFPGCFVLGGTEASYIARERLWRLHVHLLVIGADESAYESLNDKFDPDLHEPVRVQELKDPIDQLSYLQKFVTFHRPGKQTSARRARAYPLPKGPLLELLSWTSQYRFDDFRFLFGIRRRGNRIVREQK